MPYKKSSTVLYTLLFTFAVLLLVVLNGIMVSGKVSAAAAAVLLITAVLVGREAFFKK